jgi:hypothetical protein
MKIKSLILIILFFVQSFCVFAQKTPLDQDSSDKNKKKTPLSKLERSFEIGLVLLDINFANSFLSMSDLLKEVIIIDLDELTDGFKINLGVNVTPIYFNYKSKEGWGLGFSTDINAAGILNISGNMLTVNEAIKDNSDAGGAVFASTSLNTFFNVQKLKVKIAPSLFYTLAYIAPPKNMPSSIVYTLDYTDGTVMCIDYATRIYMGYSLEDGNFSLTSNPGLDFTVGFEYPLAKEIKLTDNFPFLDFDIGLDFINIPFIQSTLMDYKQIKGKIGKDTPIKLINKDDDDDEGLFSSDGVVEGERVVQVSRPFKMIFRADWRPLGEKKWLTIIPVIGFCYNNLYYDPLYLETGLYACFKISDLFLIKAGYNYTDRMFVNSLDFAINVKVCEIDVGFDLRSHEAAQVWNGSGFGIKFGLKFGW